VPDLNPDEAADWRWATPDAIDADLAANPGRYTPWFPLAWRALRGAMRADAPVV
jgi:isopentenyl-diphosphate delta-isomerase